MSAPSARGGFVGSENQQLSRNQDPDLVETAGGNFQKHLLGREGVKKGSNWGRGGGSQ